MIEDQFPELPNERFVRVTKKLLRCVKVQSKE